MRPHGGWVLALLLSLVAFAADPGPLTALGTVEFAVSDPFIERRGLRIGAEWAIVPLVSVDLSAGAYPNLGQADHTALIRTLINDLEVVPTVSRTLWRTEFGARLVPLRTPTTALGISLGAGLVHTQDDALGNPTDDAFDLFQNQTLPTWRAGVDAEWKPQSFGLRISIARVAWRERIGNSVSNRGDLWVSASFLWTPSLRKAYSDEEERLESSDSR